MADPGVQRNHFFKQKDLSSPQALETLDTITKHATSLDRANTVVVG